MEWIRIILGGTLILGGTFIFCVATFGLFKFQYVLNRLHVAAKCDTLASMLFLLGLIVFNGINFMSVKFLFILVFLWLSNPVGSHLIAETEIKSNNFYLNLMKGDKDD